MIFSGLISLISNFQLFSITNQKQIKLIDDDIELNDDQIPYQTKCVLEHRSRSNNTSNIEISDESREDVNNTFNPLPYIEAPTPESGDIYKVIPGEAFIDFKVYNMGNGEDNFEITVQVGDTTYERKLLERKGWKAVVYTAKYTRVLKPGEYQVVTVQLSVPSMVRSGSPCAVKLTATSVRDPNHPDSSKNLTYHVFIDLFRNASFVDEKIEPIYLFPDSEKSAIFKIRNVGNYVDNTIQVNVTILPEDWEVNIDSSDIPVSGIPINGTADIEVIIKTPKQVFEGIYYIRLSLMSNNENKDEVTIPVHVLKMQKISMHCKEDRKIGNINEFIIFTIIIENEGNSQDTINFSYSYLTKGMENMSWKIVFSENPLILYPYESHSIIVAVFTPPNALADTNYLTLNIREGYFIQVQGISQNNTTVTDEKELEICINPIYNFSFNKEKDRRYIILHHTQMIGYSFSVENKGNMWDLIEIWLESTPSNLAWVSIPYEERKLLAGVTEELMINFDPPPTLDVGEYNFTIYGKSVNDPSQVQSFELVIEVIEADLEITKLQINFKDLAEADVKEGETVLINALITNVGNLDYNNETSKDDVVIIFMEGSKYIGITNISYISFKRTSDKNSIWVSYPWKVGKARLYNVIVKLDPYSSFPESNIKNNELMGKIKVKAVDEKIDDKDFRDGDEEDDGIMIHDFSTILVIIFIFLILLNIIIWLNILKFKRSNKLE